MTQEHHGMGLIARMVITRIDRTTAGCGSWIPQDEVEWHGLSLIKDYYRDWETVPQSRSFSVTKCFPVTIWHGLSLIKDERTPQDAVRNSFKMKRDSQDGYQSG